MNLIKSALDEGMWAEPFLSAAVYQENFEQDLGPHKQIYGHLSGEPLPHDMVNEGRKKEVSQMEKYRV